MIIYQVLYSSQQWAIDEAADLLASSLAREAFTTRVASDLSADERDRLWTAYAKALAKHCALQGLSVVARDTDNRGKLVGVAFNHDLARALPSEAVPPVIPDRASVVFEAWQDLVSRCRFTQELGYEGDRRVPQNLAFQISEIAKLHGPGAPIMKGTTVSRQLLARSLELAEKKQFTFAVVEPWTEATYEEALSEGFEVTAELCYDFWQDDTGNRPLRGLGGDTAWRRMWRQVQLDV